MQMGMDGNLVEIRQKHLKTPLSEVDPAAELSVFHLIREDIKAGSTLGPGCSRCCG